MKKILAFVILPLVISNTGSAQVETVVRNEVSGENASVETEITNVVNQKEVRVESNQPGEIRVEVKDGEVEIESSPEASPTVTISESTGEVKGETQAIRRIKLRLFSFWSNLLSRLRSRLFFWQ